MSQSDLEKFLQECQLNSTHGCDEESCPPMHKLIAMVRLLKTAWTIRTFTPDMIPMDRHAEYIEEQLNKIARGG